MRIFRLGMFSSPTPKSEKKEKPKKKNGSGKKSITEPNPQETSTIKTTKPKVTTEPVEKVVEEVKGNVKSGGEKFIRHQEAVSNAKQFKNKVSKVLKSKEAKIGAGVLAAAGLGYGAKKVYDHQKRKRANEKVRKSIWPGDVKKGK